MLWVQLSVQDWAKAAGDYFAVRNQKAKAGVVQALQASLLPHF
jgi:hypothetical protein